MKRDLFFCVLFGSVTFFIPGIMDPYVIPKFLAAGLAALALLVLSRDREPSYLEPFMALLLVAGLVSAARGMDWRYSLVGSYVLQPFDSIMAMGLYLVVIAGAARSGITVSDSMRLLCMSALPMLIYALAQGVVSSDPLLPDGQTLHTGVLGGRAGSTQGGPIYLGAMVSLVSVSAASLLRRKDWLGGVVLGLCFVAMALTQTRGAALAMCAGLLVMAPAKWRKWSAAAGGLVVLCVVFSRMHASHLEAVDGARWDVWHIAWRAFSDNPLTGIGTSDFLLYLRANISPEYLGHVGGTHVVQAHAHNDVLHVAATMGLFGLLTYALLGCAAVLVVTVQSDDEDSLALAGMLAAYFVFSKFNPVSGSVYCVLAAIFGVASGYKFKAAQPMRWASVALGVLVCFTSARMVGASWMAARAVTLPPEARADKAYFYQRAHLLHPWDMLYLTRHVESAAATLGSVPASVRAPMAEALMITAHQAVADHPRDSYSHELFGKAVVIAYASGVPVNVNIAGAAFGRAQELAPTFMPPMLRHLAFARAVGDKHLEGKLGKRIDQVNAMVGLWR